MKYYRIWYTIDAQDAVELKDNLLRQQHQKHNMDRQYSCIWTHLALSTSLHTPGQLNHDTQHLLLLQETEHSGSQLHKQEVCFSCQVTTSAIILPGLYLATLIAAMATDEDSLWMVLMLFMLCVLCRVANCLLTLGIGLSRPKSKLKLSRACFLFVAVCLSICLPVCLFACLLACLSLCPFDALCGCKEWALSHVWTCKL